MLNAILAMRDSLPKSDRVTFHDNLPIRKSGNAAFLIIGPKGKPSCKLYPNYKNEDIRYYKAGNSDIGLDVTFNRKTPRKSLDKLIETTKSLESVCNHENLSSLKELCHRLKLVNLGECIDVVTKFLTENPKLLSSSGQCNLCLELDKFEGFPNPVQSPATSLALNEALCDIGETQEKDVFGMAKAGWNALHQPNQIPIMVHGGEPEKITLKLFSRNRQNRCYFRYGLIENNSFPVGLEARLMAKKVILGSVEQGWTYLHDLLPDGSRKYLVLSTIDIKALKPEDNAAEEVKRTLKVFQGNLPDDLNENVSLLVFRIPPRGQDVQWSLICNRRWTGKKVKEAVENWQIAFNQNPIAGDSFDLVQLCDVLNAIWKKSGKNIVLADGKSQRNKTRKPRVIINHCYEFLLSADEAVPGQMDAAVKRILKIFGSIHLPWMIRCQDAVDNGGTAPDEIKILKSLTGILLYKCGYYTTKESILDDWAFKLGQSFYRANEIQLSFFASRRRNPPANLVGRTYLDQLIRSKNPKLIFDRFIRRFAPFERWAEKARSPYENQLIRSKNLGYDLDQYRDGLPVTLPPKMSVTESVALYMGYQSPFSRLEQTNG